MPELRLTDAQRRRFESIREDLAAAFAHRYATVRDEDVVDYLLDTYTPPGAADVPDADVVGAPGPAQSNGPAAEPSSPPTAASADDASSDAGGEGDADEPADADGGASRVSSMLRLLDDHADKWREASAGDAPYEVELPDGTTEPARTKDDVRRILYQNY